MTRTTPWDVIDDGEYNEQRCVIDGHAVVLYSDRDGARWAYTLDGGEPFDIEATARDDARRECERAVGGP